MMPPVDLATDTTARLHRRFRRLAARAIRRADAEEAARLATLKAPRRNVPRGEPGRGVFGGSAPLRAVDNSFVNRRPRRPAPPRQGGDWKSKSSPHDFDRPAG
jgi:hypothetical protein